MIIEIEPQQLDSQIVAPASKSVMQRAAAIALLATGKTTLTNYELCSDSQAALNIIERLGAKVTITKKSVEILPQQKPIENLIDCHESGLSIRMFSPVAALLGGIFSFVGRGSLIYRPVDSILDALEKFGLKGSTSQGLLPLSFSGQLKGNKAKIDGSLSSQVITGLLTALPFAEGNSEITVRSLKSKPYITLTIDILKQFGIEIENQNFKKFIIKGNQTCPGRAFAVEGDWSAAAFLIIAGLISGKTVTKGLNMQSKQADVAVLEAIKLANGKLEFDNDTVTAYKSDLKAFTFDATDCPDLFPPLAVLAACSKGVSIITGVQRLKHKESNRGEVIKSEFAKMGIEVQVLNNLMMITGGVSKGGVLDSKNDHRIAMAAALLGLVSKRSVIISNAEAINKSYPNFYNDLGMEYLDV